MNRVTKTIALTKGHITYAAIFIVIYTVEMKTNYKEKKEIEFRRKFVNERAINQADQLQADSNGYLDPADVWQFAVDMAEETEDNLLDKVRTILVNARDTEDVPDQRSLMRLLEKVNDLITK